MYPLEHVACIGLVCAGLVHTVALLGALCSGTEMQVVRCFPVFCTCGRPGGDAWGCWRDGPVAGIEDVVVE